jgi:hypothetical protein
MQGRIHVLFHRSCKKMNRKVNSKIGKERKGNRKPANFIGKGAVIQQMNGNYIRFFETAISMILEYLK